MSISICITDVLVKASADLLRRHPGANVTITYREGDPEQLWHVDACDGITPDGHYVINDETGEVFGSIEQALSSRPSPT